MTLPRDYGAITVVSSTTSAFLPKWVNRDKARPSVEQKNKTAYIGALGKCRLGGAYSPVS